MSTLDKALRQTEENVQQDDEVSLLDILLVVSQNLRLLIVGPIVAGAMAVGISFIVTPTFTAETTFLPPQQQQSMAASMLQSLGAIGGLAGAASGLKNPADQYVALLKSTTVEDALIQKFNLVQRYEEKYRQDARVSLKKNTHIAAGKDGLISLSFDDKDPKFAAEVANAYVEQLGGLLNRLAVTEAQQRRAFFEKQLNETKSALTKAQQALSESGVGVAALNTNPVTALEGAARLRAQITAQEVKISSMKSYLTSAAPEFKQAQSELAALRTELAKAEREQPTAGGNDYIAKFREFKYQETLFDLFAKQFELAKVDESKEGAFIQVVDFATPPEKKSKPRRMIIAIITTLASAILLLIFTLMRNGVEKNENHQNQEKIKKIKHSIKGAFYRA